MCLNSKENNMFGLKSKAERLQDKGIQLAESGNLNEAIKYLQNAIELEPENGIFRFNLGLAFLNHSYLEEALEEFKLSIRFKPSHADGYFALATSLLPLGPDWKSAIYYLAYLDLTKSGEKAHTAKTRLTELGRDALSFDVEQWIDTAERSYEGFVQDMGKTGANIGHTISQIRPESEEAVVSGLQKYLFDIAPSKAVEWASLYFENGIKFINNSKYRVAIAQIVTGLDIFPHDQLALCILANAFTLANDYEQAIRTIDFIDVEKALSEVKPFVVSKVQEVKSNISSRRSNFSTSKFYNKIAEKAISDPDPKERKQAQETIRSLLPNRKNEFEKVVNVFIDGLKDFETSSICKEFFISLGEEAIPYVRLLLNHNDPRIAWPATVICLDIEKKQEEKFGEVRTHAFPPPPPPPPPTMPKPHRELLMIWDEMVTPLQCDEIINSQLLPENLISCAKNLKEAGISLQSKDYSTLRIQLWKMIRSIKYWDRMFPSTKPRFTLPNQHQVGFQDFLETAEYLLTYIPEK